jgi:hypothetical protein
MCDVIAEAVPDLRCLVRGKEALNKHLRVLQLRWPVVAAGSHVTNTELHRRSTPAPVSLLQFVRRRLLLY